MSPAVAPPSFGPATPQVSPPPFGAPAQADEEPEEEVIREVRIRKLVDDGVPVDDREVGKVRMGPLVAIGVVAALFSVIGYLGGSQISRAARANRAIDSADTIGAALLEDQNSLKNLKSRISGAARKALHKTSPGPDFELLDHLNSIKGNRPFAASVWSGQFYQAFKCAPTLFEYSRGMNNLWDLVGQVADRQSNPVARKALKAWPQERERVTKLHPPTGASGFGVGFRRSKGIVYALLGTFENSHQEMSKGKTFWQSDFTAFGKRRSRALKEYQPGFDPLHEDPNDWFVRVNPDLVLGPKQQLINYGGPLIAEAQDPYLRYLMDVNAISKALATVQATQDQLVSDLAKISSAHRPFTFGL